MAGRPARRGRQLPPVRRSWGACGPRVAVPHLEGAESPNLDALFALQRVLHGVENASTTRPQSFLVILGPTESAAR